MENESCVEIINKDDEDNNREGKDGNEKDLPVGIVITRVLPERTVGIDLVIIIYVVRAHDETLLIR